MNDLRIEATADTPAIDFLAREGRLSVTGKSYPQNVFQFYKPVTAWLEEYLETTEDASELHLGFSALNSSTTKVVFDWLDALERAHERKPGSVQVIWHYPAERSALLQAGEDFREAFEELPITLAPDLK